MKEVSCFYGGAILYNDRNFKYLRDVKSGGTGFDFITYVKEVIN